ncbi:uncharacterized protein LOC106649137 [Trichogramma pretiosum]|uniref:uncharacterized protein LOC106649137 n=1 Tax=Trichogramma pretiosum TaxID=7493 RepID=UPI0006C942B1|nr:uncharacterized protein LOC106649137 [Trichogramma pretiosum]
MFSQGEQSQTQKCALCNGTNFYKEDGFYFCSQCQTQNDDVREEVFEGLEEANKNIRVRKIKIKEAKTVDRDVEGWTSWELYNLVLLGLTDELIETGVDSSIKLTVLQLWTMYLTKLEVAFTSKSKKKVPKIARRYHKKDADIFYGKKTRRKRRKKSRGSATSASSMVSTDVSESGVSSRSRRSQVKRLLVKSEYERYLSSQGESETDAMSSMNQSLSSFSSRASSRTERSQSIHFNQRARSEKKRIKTMSHKVPKKRKINHHKYFNRTQYARGPDVISPLKLLSILYLALRYHDHGIQISDLLRYAREGHLSFYNMTSLLPSEVVIDRKDEIMLTNVKDITHKGIRMTVAHMAKFIEMKEIEKPSIIDLIQRYCEDLHLPRGIFLYAERLYAMSPPVMEFNFQMSHIPNYEGRAMAFIIVILKMLFSIDDITEKETSRLVEKINKLSLENDPSAAKLFSFGEWQRFIECCKSVLTNVHYPSKIKYNPDNIDAAHLFIRYMQMVASKRIIDMEETSKSKRGIPTEILSSMRKCIQSLDDQGIPLRHSEQFPPTFTPFKTYISELLENPSYELPYLLNTRFWETKVGYLTKPDKLIELASYCGIKLEVVNHSLQYFEKIVPAFASPPALILKEMSELVDIEEPADDEITENVLDFVHRDRSCKLKVHPKIFKYYTTIRNKDLNLEETLDLDEGSGFDKITSDGRLDIGEDCDSDDEICIDLTSNEDCGPVDTSILLDNKFQKKYNLSLYNHEIKSLKNSCNENSVSDNNEARENNESVVLKKKYKRIQNCTEISSDDEEDSKQSKTKKIAKKNREKENIDKNAANEEVDCLDLSDISILEDMESFDKSQKNLSTDSMQDHEILFRPFNDYWMYHCIFSRVSGKDFELFEKELPRNFSWLLNECAELLEMSSEDLYEEVCMVEAVHFNIINSQPHDFDYGYHDSESTFYKNRTMKKW